jgi:hypothetical protein
MEIVQYCNPPSKLMNIHYGDQKEDIFQTYSKMVAKWLG